MITIRSFGERVRQHLISPLPKLCVMIRVHRFIVWELGVEQQELPYHVLCIYVHKVFQGRIIFQVAVLMDEAEQGDRVHSVPKWDLSISDDFIQY